MTSTPQALRLEQARAALKDFTYSVSHDLRASLRHVTAYVQIIKEDLGDETPAVLTMTNLETGPQATAAPAPQICCA